MELILAKQLETSKAYMQLAAWLKQVQTIMYTQLPYKEKP